MSAIVSITMSAYRPDNAPDNTAMHQLVLDELNEYARLSGWAGTAIEYYGIRDCKIIISVIAGDVLATIDDLRAFKENNQPSDTQDPVAGRLL